MNNIFNLKNALILGGVILLVGIGITTFILVNKDEEKTTNDLTKITEEKANTMTDQELVKEISGGEEEVTIDNQTDDELLKDIEDTIQTVDDSYEIVNN